jgi:hypothetical protein
MMADIGKANQHPFPGETERHFQQRRRRGYLDCPEAYHLFRFTWQVFGHVTFAQIKISRHKRLSMLFATIARVHKQHRLAFKDAVWVWCEEVTESGRAAPHFHFLIAAIPQHIDLEMFCQHLRHAWRGVGGGLNKITPYDPTLDGAGYIAKCAGGFNGSTGEDDRGLTFSPAALTHLKRMAGRGV